MIRFLAKFAYPKNALCVFLFISLGCSAQSRWEIETIDGGRGRNVGKFSSLVIGRDGSFHAGYFNVTREALKYAAFNGSSWFTETVDPRSGTGKFNSLTLDRQGLPNISYSDVTSGDLCFARWDGHTWNFAKPDTSQASEGWVGIGSSIELDS